MGEREPEVFGEVRFRINATEPIGLQVGRIAVEVARIMNNQPPGKKHLRVREVVVVMEHPVT